jgi:hypothetical protein
VASCVKEVAMRNVKVLFLASLGMFAASAAMASSGYVSQISGTLSVQKPNGSVRILSMRSEIQGGDTILTQRDSYAQIKFSDGSSITLKPNSVVKLDEYQFKEDNPEEDRIRIGLVRGGIRATTGLIGKRGNVSAYQLKTASAVFGVPMPRMQDTGCIGAACVDTDERVQVIGYKGTTFAVEDCSFINCGVRKDSIHVAVLDGILLAQNDVGSLPLRVGEVGIVEGPIREPRFLPSDPGLQFTPPASFIQSVSGGGTVNAGKNKECAIKG